MRTCAPNTPQCVRFASRSVGAWARQSEKVPMRKVALLRHHVWPRARWWWPKANTLPHLRPLRLSSRERDSGLRETSAAVRSTHGCISPLLLREGARPPLLSNSVIPIVRSWRLNHGVLLPATVPSRAHAQGQVTQGLSVRAALASSRNPPTQASGRRIHYSTVQAIESQRIIASDSASTRACAGSGYSRAGLMGGSSVVSNSTHTSLERWMACSPSRCVLRTVAKGYQLQFSSPPPLSPHILHSHAVGATGAALRDEIAALLLKGAIERVPRGQSMLGYYSGYFAVKKKGGGMRPILDLRRLKAHLRQVSFWMLTCEALLKTVRHGGCLWA